MEIVEVIVEHITDKKEAIEFLNKIKDKVKICDEAVWYTQVSAATVKVLKYFWFCFRC